MKSAEAIEARLAELPPGLSLYGYQGAGARWLAQRTGGLLADEMGLGKTVQALLALPADGSAVVVCPASVKHGWARECARWRPDLLPTIVSGRDSFLRWPSPGEVAILNYEILPEAEALVAWGAPEWGVTAILDEVHYCKNWQAARSKRAEALAALARRGGGASWGLTGTPILNRPGELYQELRVLGCSRQIWPGGYPQFLRDWGARKDHWGRMCWGTPGPDLIARLRDVMLRREKADVLHDLPPKRWTVEPVEIPADLRALGDKILGQLTAAGVDMENAIQTLRVGMPGFEEFSHFRKLLADAKIPRLLELADAYEEVGEPLVIFSAHVAPVKTCAARAGWGAILGGVSAAVRAETIARFQAGELRGVALSPAGVEGITLTRASTMILVDVLWSPEMMRQVEDRIHRIGQDRPCHYISLVADHPLEERIYEIHEEKRRHAGVVRAAAVPAVAEPQRLAVTPLERAAAEGLAALVETQGLSRITRPLGMALAKELRAGRGLTEQQWRYAICICRVAGGGDARVSGDRHPEGDQPDLVEDPAGLRCPPGLLGGHGNGGGSVDCDRAFVPVAGPPGGPGSLSAGGADVIGEPGLFRGPGGAGDGGKGGPGRTGARDNLLRARAVDTRTSMERILREPGGPLKVQLGGQWRSAKLVWGGAIRRLAEPTVTPAEIAAAEWLQAGYYAPGASGPITTVEVRSPGCRGEDRDANEG